MSPYYIRSTHTRHPSSHNPSHCAAVTWRSPAVRWRSPAAPRTARSLPRQDRSCRRIAQPTLNTTNPKTHPKTTQKPTQKPPNTLPARRIISPLRPCWRILAALAKCASTAARRDVASCARSLYNFNLLRLYWCASVLSRHRHIVAALQQCAGGDTPRARRIICRPSCGWLCHADELHLCHAKPLADWLLICRACAIPRRQVRSQSAKGFNPRACRSLARHCQPHRRTADDLATAPGKITRLAAL